MAIGRIDSKVRTVKPIILIVFNDSPPYSLLIVRFARASVGPQLLLGEPSKSTLSSVVLSPTVLL